MNRDQTKDRLGANGLVNKGVYQAGKNPSLNKTNAINDYRTTVSSMMHSTPWMHNELSKKHSFYKRSPQEEAQMAQTMGSLQWGSTGAGAGRGMMSPQPERGGQMIQDDGNKKHLILSQIKENRRSMSNMSKQIMSKK